MGLSMHLTLNGGLRALLLGEGKDALSAACPVLCGKMLLLSATKLQGAFLASLGTDLKQQDLIWELMEGLTPLILFPYKPGP